MTRDALHSTETIAFDLYRVRRRASGVFVISGKHEYRDREGQHRSVYFAERMARHIRERHADVTVRLRHAERMKWTALDSDGATPGPTPGPEPPPHAALTSEDDPWTR